MFIIIILGNLRLFLRNALQKRTHYISNKQPSEIKFSLYIPWNQKTHVMLYSSISN